MSRSDQQRIDDILGAAEELAVIVARGKAVFDKDSILQRAAERLLEIIGEAANQLSESSTSSHPGVPWTDVTRLRIVLAHHYHRVDTDQVWTIATLHIPQLIKALLTDNP